MEDSKTSFCSSKLQWASESLSSKFMDNWGSLLIKVRLACPRGCMRNLVEDEAFWIKNSFT